MIAHPMIAHPTMAKAARPAVKPYTPTLNPKQVGLVVVPRSVRIEAPMDWGIFQL